MQGKSSGANSDNEKSKKEVDSAKENNIDEEQIENSCKNTSSENEDTASISENENSVLNSEPENKLSQTEADKANGKLRRVASAAVQGNPVDFSATKKRSASETGHDLFNSPSKTSVRSLSSLTNNAMFEPKLERDMASGFYHNQNKPTAAMSGMDIPDNSNYYQTFSQTTTNSPSFNWNGRSDPAVQSPQHLNSPVHRDYTTGYPHTSPVRDKGTHISPHLANGPTHNIQHPQDMSLSALNDNAGTFAESPYNPYPDRSHLQNGHLQDGISSHDNGMLYDRHHYDPCHKQSFTRSSVDNRFSSFAALRAKAKEHMLITSRIRQYPSRYNENNPPSNATAVAVAAAAYVTHPNASYASYTNHGSGHHTTSYENSHQADITGSTTHPLAI